MKKAAALLLTLALCASFSAPALADGGYGEITVSGANDMYPDGYTTTITFEAATLEYGPVRFADTVNHAVGNSFETVLSGGYTEREVAIVTVRPGSAFTVDTYQDGVLKRAGFSSLMNYPYVLAANGGYWRRDFQSSPSRSSGTIEDWFGSWNETPAMIDFKLGDTEYCVFLGESAVQRSSQRVTVDGEAVTPEVYNIDGYNYFKLRDLAMLLKDTPARFSVGYDAAAQAILVTRGADYVPDGSELADGGDRSETCTVSTQGLVVDGTPTELTAYNIGGYNYFQLRELGAVLGFSVDYNEETQTAEITTR